MFVVSSNDSFVEGDEDHPKGRYEHRDKLLVWTSWPLFNENLLLLLKPIEVGFFLCKSAARLICAILCMSPLIGSMVSRFASGV